MTLGEVKKQIINLGFEEEESYDDDPSIMIDGINRAMREITNRFPLVGEYKISQNPLESLLPSPLSNLDIKHYNGVPLEYTANGAKSFYFECDGSGTATITDDTSTQEITLASLHEFKEYKGFCNGNTAIKFSGEFSYNIKNIALYGEIYSKNIEDIPPYKEYVRYDFKELTKLTATPPAKDVYVFIEFIDKVREGDFSSNNSYTSIKNFQTEKRHILILNGFEKCQYTVFYKKDFTRMTTATPNEYEIELDLDKEHLLPLLAAWYVWEDSEEVKAAKWRNDYEDFAVALLNNVKPNTATQKFINARGW